MKDESQSKKCKISQIVTYFVLLNACSVNSQINFFFLLIKSKASAIEYINATQDELEIEEIDQLLTILSQKKDELKYVSARPDWNYLNIFEILYLTYL